MYVRERMSTPAVTVAPDATALTAIELMTSRRLRHLPVVDGRGVVVGILAERDLIIATSRHMHTGMDVDEVMSREVLTVTADTLLTDAALLMAQHSIGSLPVVDGDHCIVGILTESDILRAFVDLDLAYRAVGK